MSKSYRDLKVWQLGMQLAIDVYGVCESLPGKEKFGLCSQLQRSAVSIPSNIAEGQQRSSDKEFRQFLGIARGSAAELSTQLILAKQIYNVDTEDFVIQTETIQKMLYSLQNKL